MAAALNCSCEPGGITMDGGETTMAIGSAPDDPPMFSPPPPAPDAPAAPPAPVIPVEPLVVAETDDAIEPLVPVSVPPVAVDPVDLVPLPWPTPTPEPKDL